MIVKQHGGSHMTPQLRLSNTRFPKDILPKWKKEKNCSNHKTKLYFKKALIITKKNEKSIIKNRRKTCGRYI